MAILLLLTRLLSSILLHADVALAHFSFQDASLIIDNTTHKFNRKMLLFTYLEPAYI